MCIWRYISFVSFFVNSVPFRGRKASLCIFGGIEALMLSVSRWSVLINYVNLYRTLKFIVVLRLFVISIDLMV